MPALPTPWLLPTANELYKHRTEIKTIWDRLSALRKGFQIAVTGMSGAGKTVLCDHLSGKAPRIGYTAPGRSQYAEKGKVTSTRKRIGLAVVPGQTSQPRIRELNRLFTIKPGVDGVVHVVSNGYIEIRQADARTILEEQGITDIKKLLEFQRKQELEELQDILKYIRDSYTQFQKPKWMLVAVAKFDLYYGDAADAQHYYAGDPSSQFVQTMNGFVAQVGEANFRWEAVPVCTYLDAFQWGTESQKPQLTEPERDYYLIRFAQELERYCGT